MISVVSPEDDVAAGAHVLALRDGRFVARWLSERGELVDIGVPRASADGAAEDAARPPCPERWGAPSPFDVDKAPFPWFGGKSRVAAEVWARFGDPVNFVEPFAGSLAVLLGRPTAPKVETVNDLDAYVANFFRAVMAAPALVASYADAPVNEANLHAIHRWLVFGPEGARGYRRHIVAALEALGRGDGAGAEEVLLRALAEDRPLGPDFRERMRRDAEYFDAQIAGWWVWGLCAWIGSGWCMTDDGAAPVGEEEPRTMPEKLPLLGGTKGTGVHRRGLHSKLPRLGASGGLSGPAHGVGVHQRKMRASQLHVDRGAGTRPDLSAAGRGVHAPKTRDVPDQLPHLAGANNNGSRGDFGQSPNAGKGIHSISGRSALYSTFEKLAARLRYVRVACGDWRRILTDSVTWRHGITAIFLDPPYSDAERAAGLYAVDSGTVAAEVHRWALEHGHDLRLRVALCGYAGEHDELEARGWSVFAWQAKGGYGGQRKGEEKNDNAGRERIWFSPGCLKPASAGEQMTLAMGS